jgi:RNA polymerase sigma factor (sigma-70 family)
MAGAIGGSDDADLLARFSARHQRDEAAEAAFRMLVERHGPMVVRVCRQVIGDGHAAEEAAQAVFLVLARKAGSIRIGATVAPWLYGVARRVAARARVRAASQRAREERTARTVAAERTDAETAMPAHQDDWDAVHEEVDRLPEKYRTPVVLCYLQGQTYEEAAQRIGCPVGTIRVRLSRARDRLRDRLTRRGFGPERVAAVGYFANGMAPECLTAPGVGAGWVDATVKAAQAYIAGRAATAGVVPALALALGDEMMRSLAMSQWKLVLFALISLSATSTVALGLAGMGDGGQDAPGSGLNRKDAPGKAAATQTAPEKKAASTTINPLPEPVDVMIPKQRERLLNAAAQRLDAQRAYYEEGRITIDRFIQALQDFRDAQMEQATTREQRILAAQNHLDLMDEVVKREEAELKVGRGTVADLAEAHVARELAAVALLKAHKGEAPGDLEALKKRIETMEQKLEQVMKRLDRSE